MTEKDHKALSRLIMCDRIKHYYEVEHKSIRWIARKTNLNFRTIKKYLEMDQKEFEDFSNHVINRPHMLEPYKDFIIGKLSLYQETPAAQMHDWLKENYPNFPKVAPKTVYNYVTKIRQEYNLPKVSENERQYAALPETAPGEYAQVDFGQTKLCSSDGTRIKVYFIAILLCYSRYKFIWFQDKPFTSETAVMGMRGHLTSSIAFQAPFRCSAAIPSVGLRPPKFSWPGRLRAHQQPPGSTQKPYRYPLSDIPSLSRPSPSPLPLSSRPSWKPISL